MVSCGHITPDFTWSRPGIAGNAALRTGVVLFSLKLPDAEVDGNYLVIRPSAKSATSKPGSSSGPGRIVY